MTPDPQVDDLLDSWQAAYDAGRDVPASDLCREHPHLLPEVERRVAVLRRAAGLMATEPAAGDWTGPPSETGPYAPAPAPPPPPTLGGFRLAGLLGRGGMGAVYRADDATLGRPVALKVMQPGHAARADAKARFLREARAAAAVRDDHVCPIYHVGEDGGVPFLVMPLLEGETLAARIARVGPLPPDEVARIGREAALGLAAAHAKGLVHRDVKPANLWLEAPNGRVLVLDFGLARPADPADGLTDPGAVVGTTAYMAPEQADGQEVDARADLFGLGAALYEAATGRRAFAGKTVTAVLKAVALHDPEPPAAVNPAVPAGLSAVIMRLLSKSPADRPASAAAVAVELTGPDQAGGGGKRGEPPVASDQQAAHASRPPEPAPGRKPVRLQVGCTVAITLCLIVGVGLTFYTLSAPRAHEVAGGAQPPDLDRTAADSPGTAAKAAADAPEPLRVKELRVTHFARRADGKGEARGLLGKTSFGAALGDQVTVEAVLLRPAHAYLIACRPDGVVELLYPEDEATPPPADPRPAYPTADNRAEQYGLTDGTGLTVFAVVASDRPLPAWKDWAGKAVPWKPVRPAGGTVWLDDGARVLGAGPAGASHGDRGKGAVEPAREAVVGVADHLKRYGAAVSAVGFAVGPKE